MSQLLHSIVHPRLPGKTTCCAIGLTLVVSGLLILASLVQSTVALGEALTQEAPQQPRLVNGRAVYAVPILAGPEAAAILERVQTNDRAHVVHSFPGWGKSVSTAIGWFRCADILQINQYRGNQIEVETWFFLTEQERLEVEAACQI